MGKRTYVVCYVAMVVLVGFTLYTSLEITVRLCNLPDPELIWDMESTRASVEHMAGSFTWESPQYGWDQGGIIDVAADGSSGRRDPTTILFVGDSVTRGYKVDLDTEAYPLLLGKVLATHMPVRVVNTAVQGFGVDQMILKLEAVVPQYRPQLIVFAYIPHDLWRPARNINYGYPKPVLIPDEVTTWQVMPAPDIREVYQSYAQAKRTFSLSLWTLRHIVSNRRYYFPQVYKAYYRALFQAIRTRLVGLAASYQVNILVVRLASTWPGAPVPFLDSIAREIFAAPADEASMDYFDTEGCVQAQAQAFGINYAEEFRFHPTPIGHQMYAACLVEPLRAALDAP
jgi:hypothetical protein